MDQIVSVSVIIVNYNTLSVLQPCLDSIVAHTHDVSYEIIVVDNGSSDGSVEVLSNDSRLTFVSTGQNLGFGKANNRGLEHARGEYVFFLNSDTLLRNNAIKQLYDFSRHYAGRLGAVGCILEDQSGNVIHSYGNFPKMSADFHKLLWVPILKGLHLYHEKPPVLPDDWMKVDYVTGADLLVSRAVLDECGAFHPAFFMYYEESEMQLRFHRRGYDNVVLRGPRIVHLEGESSNDGKSSRFLRDNYRQQASEYIYYKLTEPRWKYYLFRLIHPLLRQTLWLNPNVSLSDKWTVIKRLFVRVRI
jgi:hypothetical protein